VAVFYEKRDDRNDPRWIIRQDARGLTFGLGRDINRFTRLNIIQDNQYIEQRIDFLQSIDGATQDSLQAQTPPEYQTHRLQVGVDRDFRDQPFRPTRGSMQFVTFAFAGGPLKGTSSFGKFQVISAWFTPLRENVVLAMRFRGGVIRPWEQPPTFTPAAGIDPEVAKIPTEDRYRTGGVNTIRGYAENSIPVGGGLAVLEGSAELRIGLAGPLGLEAYVDAGNVWARPEQISWDDFALGRTGQPLGLEDLRVTFGLGPRLELPIGPLRVDFSWSLRREPGRSPLVAERQFAIGPSF
jgi:outer membrane protein assembly factor BamA